MTEGIVPVTPLTQDIPRVLEALCQAGTEDKDQLFLWYDITPPSRPGFRPPNLVVTASPMAQMVKNLSVMQEIWVRS